MKVAVGARWCMVEHHESGSGWQIVCGGAS